MIQDGARRHYIVPLALQNAGILESVYADWYVRRGSIASALGNIIKHIDFKTGRRMLDRRRIDLDESKIKTNLPLAIKIARAKNRFPSVEEYYDWVSLQHADWMIRKGFDNANSIYGFIRNVHPKLLEECNRKGLLIIADQIIAPAAVENAEYDKQQHLWPGWEKPAQNHAQKLVESIEEQSWTRADHIVCGSEYVKDGLESCGVEASKITVIPYAPSGADLPLIERKFRPSPIVVGFVGSVGLRKGAPYFFEIARRFDPARVRFVMIGPTLIEKETLEREKGNVEIIGSVPRSSVHEWLTKFHVYLFPSTCEGCAGSVLEAMDTGLPIVSTYSSGTIVRNGVEGFIHPYNDVDGMAESLKKLVEDSELRAQMGMASRKRIEQFDSQWYSTTLRDLLRSELAKKQAGSAR